MRTIVATPWATFLDRREAFTTREANFAQSRRLLHRRRQLFVTGARLERGRRRLNPAHLLILLATQGSELACQSVRYLVGFIYNYLVH